MSEKRFVAEQVDVVNEDETEVWDVVFDTENTYAFMVRDTDTASGLCDLLNELSEENGQLKKVNNLLYNENIQLRRILVNYKDLIYDVKYLEEKGVFDGEKDKKNIWDVEPVVEKHS